MPLLPLCAISHGALLAALEDPPGGFVELCGVLADDVAHEHGLD